MLGVRTLVARFGSTALLLMSLAGPVLAIGGGMGGGFGGGAGGGGASGHSGGGNAVGAAPSDPLFVLCLVILAGLFVYGIALANISRCRLLNIVVVVRRGGRYTREFSRLISKMDFALDANRYIIAARLAEIVDSEDVLDGFVADGLERGSVEHLGDRAQAFWDRQVKAVDLHPSAVNVSTPRTKEWRRESCTRHVPLDDGVCLLSLVAVIPCRYDLKTTSLDGAGAVEALRSLPDALPEVLFLFYVPGVDETLSEAAASGFVKALRPRSD